MHTGKKKAKKKAKMPRVTPEQIMLKVCDMVDDIDYRIRQIKIDATANQTMIDTLRQDAENLRRQAQLIAQASGQLYKAALPLTLNGTNVQLQPRWWHWWRK